MLSYYVYAVYVVTQLFLRQAHNIMSSYIHW